MATEWRELHGVTVTPKVEDSVQVVELLAVDHPEFGQGVHPVTLTFGQAVQVAVAILEVANTPIQR